MERDLGIGAVGLVVTVVTLAFFTSLSAPVAYGVAVAFGLVAGSVHHRIDRRKHVRRP